MRAITIPHEDDPEQVKRLDLSMAGHDARLLLQELEDVAQAFPDPDLLRGDTPYGQLYRTLKGTLEAADR